MTRPSLDINRVLADAQRRRLEPPSTDTGVQWFVDFRFDELTWYRDASVMNALLDGLTATCWFADFDVIARGHQPGVPLDRDLARGALVAGTTGTVIFARGPAQMTIDIDRAESAMAVDIYDGRLELRVWLALAAVRRHRRKALDDMIGFVLAWCEAVPDALLANALAFPRPTDGLRYARTRPLRIANRALDAVVDIVDRRAPSEGPLWGPDSLAMAAAPTPPEAIRSERGPLVVVRWIEDPSDLTAMASACSRHEQWVLPLVGSRLAPGWNAAGDMAASHDDAHLVEAASGTGLPPARRGFAVVLPGREAALAAREAATAAGYAAALYRDEHGALWDPSPPGVWASP